MFLNSLISGVREKLSVRFNKFKCFCVKMIDFNEKKFAFTAIIIAILALSYAVFRISEESRVILIPLLLWAVFSAYVIFKGRPDETGVNIVRRLGVWMVIAMGALMGGGILLLEFVVSLDNRAVISLVFSMLLLIAMALLIAGVVYAIRKQAKLVLVPIFILGIVFLMVASFWFDINYSPSERCGFPDPITCGDYDVSYQ